MTAADLKLKIFREVDSLQESRLEEVYGILTNYLRGHKDLDDWGQLTEEQKNGIFEAIEDIDKGKGISHNKVMANIRKKYA
ncbi:MAG: hypothetical protein ACOX5K_06995 [Bacteroidales bacterium]|jgi:hypothetical protein|nr:hypothetical protein [Bacteroidota bacterium]